MLRGRQTISLIELPVQGAALQQDLQHERFQLGPRQAASISDAGSGGAGSVALSPARVGRRLRALRGAGFNPSGISPPKLVHSHRLMAKRPSPRSNKSRWQHDAVQRGCPLYFIRRNRPTVQRRRWNRSEETLVAADRSRHTPCAETEAAIGRQCVAAVENQREGAATAHGVSLLRCRSQRPQIRHGVLDFGDRIGRVAAFDRHPAAIVELRQAARAVRENRPCRGQARLRTRAVPSASRTASHA